VIKRATNAASGSHSELGWERSNLCFTPVLERQQGEDCQTPPGNGGLTLDRRERRDSLQLQPAVTFRHTGDGGGLAWQSKSCIISDCPRF
jgi:hypothetical protein